MTSITKRQHGDFVGDMAPLAERLFTEPPLLLALINPELRYVRISHCFADVLDREAVYFTGKSVVRNGFTARHKAVMQKALDKNQTQVLENWTVTPAGQKTKTRGYWQWTISPLHDTEGRVCSLLLSGCDITKRRLLESDVIEAAARERREIGLEIRDNIGQILAAIGVKAKILELKVEDQQLAGAQEARELRDLATEVLVTHRRIAHMLYPVDLEAGGFLANLGRLAEDTTQLYGVWCQVTAPDHEPDLEPVQAVHIHAIVKKAIEHSVRQAGARDVAIEFFVKPDQYRVKVTHDGKAYKRTGAIKGYRMMNFHAHTIGGVISVEGCTGELVTFTGRFPRIIGDDS